MKLVAYDTSTLQPLFLNLGVPFVRYYYCQLLLSIFKFKNCIPLKIMVFNFIDKDCSQESSKNTNATVGDFDKGMYKTKTMSASYPKMPDFLSYKLFLVSIEYFLLRQKRHHCHKAFGNGAVTSSLNDLGPLQTGIETRSSAFETKAL